jgi:hypothetical protein
MTGVGVPTISLNNGVDIPQFGCGQPDRRSCYVTTAAIMASINTPRLPARPHKAEPTAKPARART